MFQLLNRLLNKKDRVEKKENNTSDNAADNIHKVKRGSWKGMSRYFLLFLFCAGVGFAAVSYMALDNKTIRKMPAVSSQFSNIAPAGQGTNRGSNVWMSGQAAQTPQTASNAIPIHEETKADKVVSPAPVSAVTATAPPSTGGRDVFKEFYISHPGQSSSSKGVKDIGKTLDKFLPPLPGMSQPLPVVQTLSPQPAVDQIKEIKISGTACVVDNDCVAITSEGTLKKGDKLGGETVLDISKTSFITTKRTLELN